MDSASSASASIARPSGLVERTKACVASRAAPRSAKPAEPGREASSVPVPFAFDASFVVFVVSRVSESMNTSAPSEKLVPTFAEVSVSSPPASAAAAVLRRRRLPRMMPPPPSPASAPTGLFLGARATTRRPRASPRACRAPARRPLSRRPDSRRLPARRSMGSRRRPRRAPRARPRRWRRRRSSPTRRPRREWRRRLLRRSSPSRRRVLRRRSWARLKRVRWAVPASVAGAGASRSADASLRRLFEKRFSTERRRRDSARDASNPPPPRRREAHRSLPRTDRTRLWERRPPPANPAGPREARRAPLRVVILRRRFSPRRFRRASRAARRRARPPSPRTSRAPAGTRSCVRAPSRRRS